MGVPVPWTFDAGGTVSEQLIWMTNILPAETGPEQTRRLRIAPRVIVSFDGLESGRNRRWMENLLNVNGAGRWEAPLVMDTARLGAPLGAASDMVAFDTTDLRFTAGGQALLIANDPRRYEVVQIDTVAVDHLALAEVTALDWGIGTRILPLRTSHLDGMPTLSRFTGDDTPYQVSFRLDEPLEVEPDAGDTSYRGAPVLEWVPVWTSDPETIPERQLLTVDEETGPIVTTDMVGIPLGRTSLAFALVGRSTIAAFRRLLYALCGRWSPIWVPSQVQDLSIVTAVADGATYIDVEHSGLAAWPLAVNRRDIRLRLSDGTVLYRRITAAVELSNSVERLALDSVIVTGFDVNAVSVVSFMALCRQDSDVNKLIWWNHDTVECDLTFRAVSHGL